MKKGLLLFSIICLYSLNSYSQKVITNADVVSMRNAKFSKKDIVSTLSTARCKFDLTTEGLIRLKTQKISDRVVRSMFIVSPPKEDFITNKDIIKLSKSKVSDDLINIKIRSTPHRFDISPMALIKLKKSGVPRQIIKTMKLLPIKEKELN